MMFIKQAYHHLTDRLPWRAIGSVLLAFLITRLMVFIVIYFSVIEIPVRERSDYFTVAPHNLVESGLIRWDSRFFLQIITTGYSPADNSSNAAFFPFYPLMVSALYKLFGHPSIAFYGLLVSNLLLLVALAYLYALTRQEYDDATAGRAVFYLAAAPAAFVLSAFYSDSALIAFSIACFYYAHNRRWGLAALMGAAASASQISGFLVAVFIVMEGLRQQGAVFLPRPWTLRGQVGLLWADLKLIPRIWTPILAAVGTMAGWLAFMVYLQNVLGDPWAFIHTNAGWGRSLGWDWFPRLIDNTLTALHFGGNLMSGPFNPIAFKEVAAALIFLPLVIAVMVKMPPPYAWFTFLMYMLAPLSGTLESMPRFLLWLLPCYMLLGVWGKRPWLDRLIIGVSLPLQAYLTILFSHWYFAV